MKLDFVQIIYDDIQAQHCYPFARIHKNETLTSLFENDIIRKLVPCSTGDNIGVCSWRLAQKRGDMFQLINKAALTEQRLTEAEYDVAVLTPRSPNHKPLMNAVQWHFPNWSEPFRVFKNFLRTDLGIRVPEELSNSIYENHFVAKREIYHEYVRNCLTPAIDFVNNNELYLLDANYAKRKSATERQAYFEITGRRDWPIAPFILERLFSIYCEGKGFKIIAL